MAVTQQVGGSKTQNVGGGGGGVDQILPPGGGGGGGVPPVEAEVASFDGLVTEFYARAVLPLPEDLYQIERATWNNRKIAPLRSRDLEECDTRYEITAGAVDGYLVEKDGERYLRKYRVPSSAYQPYAFETDVEEDSSDGFGILRDLEGIVDDLAVSGDWGDLVSIQGVEVFEDFGIIGPIYSDTDCVRVEYRRRGRELGIYQQQFDIPDRYITLIRHYAIAQALEREGKGQDEEFAEFHQSRYAVGIERMKKRQSAMQFQKKFIMGGQSRSPSKRLARLPYPYAAQR